MIVCDIQGVEDLFTDPQVHTSDGKGYGQGNLGVWGVHTFLCSHTCNEICAALGLPPPRIEEAVIEVECPPGVRPGERLEQYLEGPDGQLHDWQVPMDAMVGSRYRQLVKVVAEADRAVCPPVPGRYQPSDRV